MSAFYGSLGEKFRRDRNELAAHLHSSAFAHQTIVFTNGVFDLLHSGHVTYLNRARDLGHALVMGVNSDASVRRLNKGPERPLNALADRMLVLAGLACVDYLVAFEEDTPVETLEILRPQIHCKGGDYRPEDLPETATVEGYGGRVVVLPFVPGYSTTDLVKRMQQ
ncbi:MAG: D-glycero-beta-D-manno-heptose 1-phosphate adenylyltransferase [Leptospirales bacterium]|jgi:rfaE bifunctional protein nucleotidyltransferase chain/domain